LTLPISAVARRQALPRDFPRWAAERVQWGRPDRAARRDRQKIGSMAANTLANGSRGRAVRCVAERAAPTSGSEAANRQLYNSEAAGASSTIRADRGGRGYETADSAARARRAAGAGRAHHARLPHQSVFEGPRRNHAPVHRARSVDKHLQIAGDVVLPGRPPRAAAGLVRSAGFYGWWYPSRWLGLEFVAALREFGRLAKHVRFVEHSLPAPGARRIHSMIRFGPKLELRQSVLFRLVDVAAELFAMAANLLARAAPLRA